MATQPPRPQPPAATLAVPDPSDPPAGIIPFGVTEPGTSREQTIGMPIDALKTHAYVCGATGSGKSAILESFVLGLARNDRCVIVVDPHGELADNAIRGLLALHPDRGDDIVVVDFGDRGWPVAFNALAIERAGQLAETADRATRSLLELLGVSPASAPRAIDYVEQAIWALCEANLRAFSAQRAHALTLLDVPAFLTDADFRALVMQFCTDQRVVSTFGRDGTYEKLTVRDRTQRTMRIVRSFLALIAKQSFANVFGQSESKVDFAKWVRENKLVFVKLPAIASDATVVTFAGAMIARMLVTGASEWGQDPELAAFLVVDEFQSSPTESYKHLLAQTSGHGLRGILANQTPEDLPPDVLRSVQCNAQTKISMRLDPAAAKKISDFVASDHDHPSAEDLTCLDNYSGWANVMIGDGRSSGPLRFKSLPPLELRALPGPEAAAGHDQREAVRVRDRSRMLTAAPVDQIREQRHAHIAEATRIMESKVRARALAMGARVNDRPADRVE